MDTSATTRKATTEAEKEKLRKEGRCFECGKQGHLTRNCPDRKPRVRTAKTEETTLKVEEVKTPSPTDIANWLRNSTKEDKASFIKAMAEAGEDMGFLEA